jgi:hypothetical protein
MLDLSSLFFHNISKCSILLSRDSTASSFSYISERNAATSAFAAGILKPSSIIFASWSIVMGMFAIWIQA